MESSRMPHMHRGTVRATEIHQDLGTVGSSIPPLLISLSFLQLKGRISYKSSGSSLGSGSNHQTHFTAPTEGVYWKWEWYWRMAGGGADSRGSEEGTDSRERWFVSCLKKTGSLANADEIPLHTTLGSIKSVTVRERPAWVWFLC